MNWYRIKFKLKSWVASAWQADTIFGHLCWGMRYSCGSEKLKNMLKLYSQGNPPLLLSNGFPGDYLPVPVLPAASFSTSLPLDQQLRAYDQNKDRKKVRWMSLADFNRVLNGLRPEMKGPSPLEFTRVTVKNQINRMTDSTGQDGNLFNFEEFYCPEISIYLRIQDDFVEQACQLFKYMADSGYGKRKSAGYGQIEICTFEKFTGFCLPGAPNGFISLSNFVPAVTDPVKGWWKTITKYGKMGEEYSVEEKAFKKPVIMMEAGASFFDSPVRSFYGCMLDSLNPGYPDAVQYALALPVPAFLP